MAAAPAPITPQSCHLAFIILIQSLCGITLFFFPYWSQGGTTKKVYGSVPHYLRVWLPLNKPVFHAFMSSGPPVAS